MSSRPLRDLHKSVLVNTFLWHGSPPNVPQDSTGARSFVWPLVRAYNSMVPRLRPEDRIKPGIPREDALQAFRECVNKPGTIFSTDFWLLPKLDRLRQLMHDPVTHDEACALLDVLYQRRWMRDLMAWLEDDPVSWYGHFIRASFRETHAELERQSALRKLDEDWAKGIHPANSMDLWPYTPEEDARREASHAAFLVKLKTEYLPQADPCPTCKTPPEHLEWFHFSSPPSTWANWCGRAGVKTRCKFCRQEVDFFVLKMN